MPSGTGHSRVNREPAEIVPPARNSGTPSTSFTSSRVEPVEVAPVGLSGTH